TNNVGRGWYTKEFEESIGAIKGSTTVELAKVNSDYKLGLPQLGVVWSLGCNENLNCHTSCFEGSVVWSLSYGLGEDFFIVLRQMFESRPELSYLLRVKDSKIPLMRFKYDGISIDLLYAQLKVMSVPDNVDILNPFVLANIDETSWKCLSGGRANMQILQLVLNCSWLDFLEEFTWLFSQLLYVVDFLMPVTLHLSQSSLKLLHIGHWPTPVMLQDIIPPMNTEHSLMPIQFPSETLEFCRSNFTKSTFQKIRIKFLRGHTMIREVLRPNFEWSSLFEPFPYTKKHKRFVRIFVAATNQNQLGDWVGWIKLRFRRLLLKPEEVQGHCDPNPTEYVKGDHSFCSYVVKCNAEYGTI
ncbi:hypothetical protein MKX03_020544, partial [Papaver bracteatum]